MIAVKRAARKWRIFQRTYLIEVDVEHPGSLREYRCGLFNVDNKRDRREPRFSREEPPR